MKKESAVFHTPFLCGILLGGILCVGAQTGTIYETYAGVEYTVDRYDKGGSPTFEVSFTDNDITSNYKFNADGFVKTFKADSEKYTMTYKKNGKLKKLKRKSSRRQLEEEDAIDITLVDETAPVKLSVAGETVPAPVVRRRLFECDECLQTWDVVCGNGVDTVCRLDGYGSPILSAGKESISSYCHYFGSLCNERTSDDVCQDECDADYECLAPLTVKLEIEHTGESESTSEEGVILDLYVIDPEGQTVYWENPSTDIGYFSDNGYSQTYKISSGIDSETAIGGYTTFVDWYSGPAPIIWNITATTGSGYVALKEEGEFNYDCGDHTSNLFVVHLDEYVDNNC